MNLLLDTCTFLWLVSQSDRLSPTARRVLESPQSEVYLSAVSVWEIIVKVALGKLPLPVPPSVYVPTRREAHQVLPLPLGEDAVLQVEKLPRLHGDPFDRMLIGQAIAGSLAIVTPDPAISRYPVRTIW